MVKLELRTIGKIVSEKFLPGSDNSSSEHRTV